jgi:hypothetical protein
MYKIHIGLKLDSALLAGGPGGELESTGVIRGSSLRGLFRTFGRAYIGFLIGNSTNASQTIRILEDALFGMAGDEKGLRGNTFRVANVGTELLTANATYLNVPKHAGDQHGETRGFRPHSEKKAVLGIDVTVPLRSISSNPHFSSALEAICWLSLTLGSIGKRSRRGYGSLSILTMENGGLKELAPSEFPVFELVQNSQVLAEEIKRGVMIAHERLMNWLRYEFKANVRLAKLKHSSFVPGYHYVSEFFQYAGLENIYVSDTKADYRQIMQDFNTACHEQSSQQSAEYSTFIGRASHGRLASPVWLRIHETIDGFVGVITLSPPVNKVAKSIAQNLIDSIKGTSIAARCP